MRATIIATMEGEEEAWRAMGHHISNPSASMSPTGSPKEVMIEVGDDMCFLFFTPVMCFVLNSSRWCAILSYDVFDGVGDCFERQRQV